MSRGHKQRKIRGEYEVGNDARINHPLAGPKPLQWRYDNSGKRNTAPLN